MSAESDSMPSTTLRLDDHTRIPDQPPLTVQHTRPSTTIQQPSSTSTSPPPPRHRYGQSSTQGVTMTTTITTSMNEDSTILSDDPSDSQTPPKHDRATTVDTELDKEIDAFVEEMDRPTTPIHQRTKSVKVRAPDIAYLPGSTEAAGARLVVQYTIPSDSPITTPLVSPDITPRRPPLTTTITNNSPPIKSSPRNTTLHINTTNPSQTISTENSSNHNHPSTPIVSPTPLFTPQPTTKPISSKGVSFAVAPESITPSKSELHWLPSTTNTGVVAVHSPPGSPFSNTPSANSRSRDEDDSPPQLPVKVTIIPTAIAPIEETVTPAAPSPTHKLRQSNSSATETVDPVDDRYCWCFRLKRHTPKPRFPTDEAIITGDKRHRGKVHPSKSSLHKSTYAASPDSPSAAANSVTPSLELDPYDLALAADFITVTPTANDSTPSHPYAFVYSWNRCWQSIIQGWFIFLSVYEALQPPALCLLHLTDTILDILVVYYWSSSSSSLQPYDHVRWAWVSVGCICLALPTIISSISDLLRPPQPTSTSAPPTLGKFWLILLDIFQLRGFYECVLIRRIHRASLQHCTTDGPVSPRSPRPAASCQTLESQEMHSMHLTRAITQIVPMMYLQLGVLALTYNTSIDLDGTGGGPSDGWANLSIISLFTSLISLSTTGYRLLTTHDNWREKAGISGLILFAIIFLIHPAQTSLSFILLLAVQPHWVVAITAVGAVLLTGALMVAAEYASPTRRPNVEHWSGIIRTVFMLAPVELITGGISLSDLVQATSKPMKEHLGVGDAWRWVKEYWPLIFFQTGLSIGCLTVYLIEGHLWLTSIGFIMPGMMAAHLLALAFLIPKVNV